jgi:hypothetical protein
MAIFILQPLLSFRVNFADKQKLESLLASFNSESVSEVTDDLFFKLAVDVNGSSGQ